MAGTRSPISRAPSEVLSMIIGYLDLPSYVEKHLDDDPMEVFDLSGEAIAKDKKLDLKNASMVCRDWRHICRPMLFRHLRLRIRQSGESPSAFCNFMRAHQLSLASELRSVTVFILPPHPTKTDDLIAQLCEALHVTMGDFYDSVDQNLGQEHAADVAKDSLPDLWACIRALCPQRLTVVGTGSTLASYLIGQSEYCIKDMGCRFPRLRFLSVWGAKAWSGADILSKWTIPLASVLLMFQWDHLLINEGSKLCTFYERYLDRHIYRRGDEASLLESVLLDECGLFETPLLYMSLQFVNYISLFDDYRSATRKFCDPEYKAASLEHLRIRTLPKEFTYDTLFQNREICEYGFPELETWYHRLTSLTRPSIAADMIGIASKAEEQPEKGPRVIDLPDLVHNPCLWVRLENNSSFMAHRRAFSLDMPGMLVRRQEISSQDS